MLVAASAPRSGRGPVPGGPFRPRLFRARRVPARSQISDRTPALGGAASSALAIDATGRRAAHENARV